MRTVNPALSTTQCTSCGFTTGQFEAAHGPGSGYDRLNMNAYERSIGQMRTDEAPILAQHIAYFSPSQLSWLDVGCGTGRLLAEISSTYQSYGVEPDAIARGLAAAASPNATFAGDLRDLHLANASVGVISLLDVLEHIQEERLQTMLASLRDLLTADGLLLIKVPSSDGLFYRAAKMVSRFLPALVSGPIERLWLLKYPSPHYVYFNDRSLRYLLERCGYAEVKTFYLPTLPVRSAFFRLTMDGSISKWKAALSLPIVAILAAAERIMGRTDSLVVIARRRESRA